MSRRTHVALRLTAPRQAAVAEIMRREGMGRAQDAIAFAVLYASVARRAGGGRVTQSEVRKLPTYLDVYWYPALDVAATDVQRGEAGLTTTAKVIDHSLEAYMAAQRSGRIRVEDVRDARHALDSARSSLAETLTDIRDRVTTREDEGLTPKERTLARTAQRKVTHRRARDLRYRTVRLYYALAFTPHSPSGDRAKCPHCKIRARLDKIEKAHQAVAVEAKGQAKAQLAKTGVMVSLDEVPI